MYSKESHKPKRKDVYVDVEFERIGEIDIIKELYFAEVTLTISWDINGLAENFDPNVHWHPKISIENTFGKLDEKIFFDFIKDSYNTKIIEKRKIKGQFWERMEIERFPIDIQELSITLVSDSKINFITNENTILKKRVFNTFVEQQRWRLYRHVVTTDTPSYDIDSEDTILGFNSVIIQSLTESSRESVSIENGNKQKKVFKVFCSRKPNYYYWNAFFLIFLITAAAIAIFSIDPKLPQNRLQISATILLTSVTFKWVVNRTIPMNNYLTSLDRYSIVCIFFIICTVGWHGLVNVWDKDYAKQVDKWVLLGFGTVFIIFHFLFILSFIICHRKLKELERDELKAIAKIKSN